MSATSTRRASCWCEKAALRNAELAATERHLDRLREGRPETLETTSLHLDVLRDLRRIHSHICSVAYPVLDAAGELAAYRAADSEVAGASIAAGTRALKRAGALQPLFSAHDLFGKPVSASRLTR